MNNYGNLKKELDLFDEAIEYFKKALLLNENSFEVNYNLATVYQGIGDYKNAITYFEKASNINSNFTKVDRNISSMTNYTEENRHFVSMKKKILNKDLKEYQKLELHFALGKAYEDIKDYKNAFENINDANFLMKKITVKTLIKIKNYLTRLKNFLSKEFLDTKTNEIKTIFILGMPRSGTTLVEQIVSSHTKVFGGGELIYLNNIINEKFLNNQRDLNDEHKVKLVASLDEGFKNITNE